MSSILINNVVIRELIKKQHKDIQRPKIKEDVLDPNNEIVNSLVSGVSNLYSRKNNTSHYGTFKQTDDRGTFPDEWDSYSSKEACSSEEFLSLTFIAMKELQRLAQEQPAASGGYLLFADYLIETKRFFLVAMLKRKSGIRLTDDLVPASLEQVDLNSIYQAARINVVRYNEFKSASEDEKQEINYLSFVSPSTNVTTAGYFISAIGCSKGTASAKATKNLIDEASAFFRNKDELKNNRLKFKGELINYLNEQLANGVSAKLNDVEAIARKYFPKDVDGSNDSLATDLINHLNSDDVGVPAEFPPNKAILKKHTHLKYVSDNWQLLFDWNALGVNASAELQYVSDSGQLIINRLPHELKSTIEAELKEKGLMNGTK